MTTLTLLRLMQAASIAVLVLLCVLYACATRRKE